MKAPPNRRTFLYCVVGAAGSAAAGVHFFRPHTTKSLRGASELTAVKRTSRAMGADVSITIVHHDVRTAEWALDRAFDEIETVEQLMSIYRPDSELRQLNEKKRLIDPHPYLFEILDAAQNLSQRTNGAFDITVQPLWQLHADTQRAKRLPTPDELNATRQRVDWRRVKLSSRRIELGDETEITLNGIAQGFAADRVSKLIRGLGITNALIDTGEIGSVGKNKNGNHWSVGVQHPRNADSFVSLAKLSNRCLATSGDYATSFSSDFRHHHIFDPCTASSPTELASVSIAAPTAMQADGLSTAVLVMGLTQGARLIESMPRTDALFVLKDGRTLATDGFPIG